MRYEVFSVLDAIAGAFLTPLFMRNRGEAIRAFSDSVNSADHQFNKHAGDYLLFSLGHWEDDTGNFIPLKNGIPERLVTGRDVLDRGVQTADLSPEGVAADLRKLKS